MSTAEPPLASDASASPSEETEAHVTQCPNCGATLTGAYCATCGQKDQALRLPVYRFVSDAVKEYFGIDGRLWRSLGLLLFKPGRLTREYFEGRRARYLRPLRLYLTATLTFFFLLSVLDPAGRVETALSSDIAGADTTVLAGARLADIEDELAAYPARLEAQATLVDSLEALKDSLIQAFQADSTAGLIDSLALDDREDEVEEAIEDYDDEAGDLERMRTSSSRARAIRQLEFQRDILADFPPDSAINAHDLDIAAQTIIANPDDDNFNLELPDWVPQSRSVRQLRAARTAEERTVALAAFIRDTIRRLPTVMFLLLPIFALILKLIYTRRDWYYSEHLVFGLHTHAFAFTVFAVIVVLIWLGSEAAWISVLGNVLVLLVLPVYFYVAQKRVYEQGWIKTAIKAWMLGWMYGFVLIVGLVLAVLLAAAL